MRAAAGLGLGAAVLLLLAGGCRREADIFDEPDAGIINTPTIGLDGDVPRLDAALGPDAYPACEERSLANCPGANDFYCGFVQWVQRVAKECQTQTGCVTDGWLVVKMGSNGCVAEIGMDEPNDEIVACLLDQMGSTRCACQEMTTTYYFGSANDGVCPDGGSRHG